MAITERTILKYKVHAYVMQILFICGIIFGSKSMNMDNVSTWGVCIARYLIYMLVIKATQVTCVLAMDTFARKKLPDVFKLKAHAQIYAAFLAAAVAALLYSNLKIFDETFVYLFIAYMVVKYPEMGKRASSISYGTGMACSFFEGYLNHVIPSDGAHFVGFQENINIYENKEKVVFPVRRLFIVITKSLRCPPDLKAFNKENRSDLPKLDACKSLEKVEKDVAGVKTRRYSNSAYQIVRPGMRPVYLAVECATPLHTLYGVLQKKDSLYEQLSNINTEEVIEDFTRTLKSILSKSPDCKDKCELVFYNDEDPNENLADVLLNTIRMIEPNFENIRRDS